MFTLTFTKNKSKNYNEALRLAMSLGAKTESGVTSLGVAGADLLYAYRNLFTLIKLIYKWSGTTATYKGVNVHPFRFVFYLWDTVATCSAKMNKTGSITHCMKSPTEKGWGCKLLTSLKHEISGNGDYEKGHPYWYNYGFFSESGGWMIDKEAIWNKLKNEITLKGLDVCPFFDIKKVKREVFDELPDIIIIDHVTFRAHFEIRYECGERKIVPVNVRHISTPAESYKYRERKLISGLSRSMFYGLNELEMPEGIINKNKRLADKLEVLKETDRVVRVFKDGVCKN